MSLYEVPGFPLSVSQWHFLRLLNSESLGRPGLLDAALPTNDNETLPAQLPDQVVDLLTLGELGIELAGPAER